MAKSKSTKAPSGLSIKRNNDTYTCAWKKGETYKNQQFQYRINSGKWVSASVGAGWTSKAIGVSRNNYYPRKNAYVSSVSFRVRGRKKGGNWSGWVAKSYAVNLPPKPSVSQELSGSQSNVTTFSWDISVDNTNAYMFADYEYQSIRADDSNENDGSKLTWNSDAAGWITGSGTATTYSREITEDTSALMKGSHTRWFRIRSRGIRGASAWAYTKHIYSIPNAAIIKSATADITEAGGFVAHVEWEAPTSNAYPIDNTTVQYSITTPDINMGYPDGGSWENANVSKDTEDTDGATFSIDGALNEDQCLFVRVNTEHDSQITYGIPAIAAVGRTANPTGLSVQTDTSTHRATITATNNSNIEDSFLVVLFATASEPDKAFPIGIIPKTQNSITVQCPNWGDEVISFGVYSAVGSYARTEREDGVSAYAVEEKMRSIETIWEGGKIPVAPSNVNVSATPTTGTVMVTWDWAWEDANVAELSWADHADAWESTDEPDDYRITNLHASQWNIAGLETGKKWYIRVRLIKDTEAGETASPYSAIASIDLSSAPAIPSLSLSAGVIAETDTVTAYWSYITTDGTLQSYAEICEAEITANGIVYGDIIAHTESAQHITINPHDAGWSAGETHNLCVRVVSGAGRQSDGWSAPVPIIIAEPLTAEITQTSLVTQDIDVNPRTFTGNPIQFTTDLEETVTDLEVTLEPIQDLHGYDHPWVGGAGKNKLPFTEKSQTLNGATFTVDSGGLVTTSGTPTASAFFKYNNITLPAGTYKFYSDADTTKFRPYVYNATQGTSFDINTSFDVAEGDSIDIYLQGKTGQNLNGQTVTMMICLATVTDTTYEPYSNLCPISGWDSVEAYDTGVNVWDEEWEVGYIDANTGANIASTNQNKRSSYISVLPNTTYYFKRTETSINNGIYCYYDVDKRFISSAIHARNTTFTMPSNARYMRFAFVNCPTIVQNDISINYPATDTEYHAYNGHTHTATFDETVYGGTVDLVSGVLTVDRAYVDLGTLTWNTIAQYGDGYFNARINDREVGQRNLICSNYAVSSAGGASAIADGEIIGGASNLFIYIRDSRYTSAADFKSAMNGVQLVYELAEPRTIQLDPQTITTLVGVNNIWSDGDIKMRIAETTRQALCLTEMPLTVTVKGAGEGTTSLVIERAAEYHVDRPDETEFTGFDKEPVAQMTQTGEAQMTITTEDVYGALDDEAQYRIVATVQDGLGQSSTVSQEFEVHWAHQAVEPTASVRIEDGVAVISAQKPSEWLEGDVIDIYRLSVDRPELIVQNGDFGVEYVDPYPAIGEFGGHRVVYKTGNGDYIDHYNIPAWVDLDEEDGDILDVDYAIIDFDGNQIQLEYDVGVSHNWEKDFQETRYMGGSIAGDWNVGVGRTSSLSGTTINIVDQEKIAMIKELAVYEGECHLRTLDGSSIACDIQVSESNDSSKYNAVSNFSFSVTEIDTQELDGMTYEMWLEGRDELE